MTSTVKQPTSLTVELPYPPSLNHLRSVVRGRLITTAAGRAYRDRVAALLFPCKPLSGDLRVEIDAYPPDRRRRDLDNLLKILLDSCQRGGAFMDDSQIAELNVICREVVRSGKVMVRVTRIERELSTKE